MRTQKVHFTTYKAKDGWRWHAKRSGRIIADSGEAYTRKSSCKHAAADLVDAVLRLAYDI